MKKIVAFFLALSMAVVMLAGCGASQTPTTTEAPKAETKAATEAAPAAETEQKELTIAGIVFKDEFTMKMVQQGYEDAAKDYGVNIVIGNSMGDLANEQQLVYSYPVIIFFVAAVLCYFIMEHTTTGRSVYAVGGNQEAARLTGINVFKSKAFVFIAVQILAAIAGFINSAQVNQADWSYGKEWPTDCLSMAIIGGTSMAGGSGTIYGTVVGVVLISVLINGMTILNWNIYLQYIVRGAILIGSLVLMAYRDKYRD